MQSLEKRVKHQNVFELFYSRVLVNWNFYPRIWVQSSKRKRLYRFLNLLRESQGWPLVFHFLIFVGTIITQVLQGNLGHLTTWNNEGQIEGCVSYFHFY